MIPFYSVILAGIRHKIWRKIYENRPGRLSQSWIICCRVCTIPVPGRIELGTYSSLRRALIGGLKTIRGQTATRAISNLTVLHFVLGSRPLVRSTAATRYNHFWGVIRIPKNLGIKGFMDHACIVDEYEKTWKKKLLREMGVFANYFKMASTIFFESFWEMHHSIGDSRPWWKLKYFPLVFQTWEVYHGHPGLETLFFDVIVEFSMKYRRPLKSQLTVRNCISLRIKIC
jgi:hypothetical protein